MKKKMFTLLLLVPFVVGILAFVSSKFVIRQVEQDVSEIQWDYESNTPFKMSEGKKKLEAKAIFDNYYPLSDGNELIWTSENTKVASILKEKEDFYLVPKSEGRSIITCSNVKKTIQKSFTAVVVGDSGAIIVNPIIPFSQTSLTNKHYVGLYDSIDAFNDKKIDSNMKVDIDIVGGNLNINEIKVNMSDNLTYNSALKQIGFKNSGDAFIEFNNPYSEIGDFKLEFTLIDAINVYDYNSLINTTNKADKGYPIVLRSNLESLTKTYNLDHDGKPLSLKSDDTKLFGNINKSGKIVDFNEDIYRFETTYNHDFLLKWNEAIEQNKLEGHKKTSIECLSGIHIRDDFYGNGFTINTHNLVYPSLEKEIEVNGQVIKVSSLGANDLFRGPLLYTSLGDPNFSITEINPIFSLFGQDNSSFYIDGDDITLEDVHFKGADFGINLTNLQYSGSVIDVHGDNVTIKDSIIENGRNVIRSYSSENLKIENTLLRNGMEFLFRSGSNEFNHADNSKRIDYKIDNGTGAVTNASNYLKYQAYVGEDEKGNTIYKKDYKADSILTNGILHNTQISDFAGIPLSGYTEDELIEGRDNVVNALTNTVDIIDPNGNINYKGSATLNNVFFANSGISAISMDSLPQGSFIQNGITSLFGLIIGQYLDMVPSNLALTGYPTKVNITGDSRFYDWKDTNNLTFESLLQQDIATLIAVHGGIGNDFTITEDDFLPIKKILLDNHKDELVINEKVNLPITFMGGGLNLSEVNLDENLTPYFTKDFDIDPYKYSLSLKQTEVPDFNTSPKAKLEAMKIAMLRATSNVMGFNPFKIKGISSSNGKWINEVPKIEDLKELIISN